MTTFNRRFADQISAHRESFTPPPVEHPREGRVSGWQNGGYVVDVAGSRSVRQSATNGSIPVGGVACVRGRVDAQPAIATQPKRPGVRVDAKGGVKILFSVDDDATQEIIYYLGGDRREPIEVWRDPYFGTTRTYSFVNTGGRKSDWYYQYLLQPITTPWSLYDSRTDSFSTFPLAHKFRPLGSGGYLGDGIWGGYSRDIGGLTANPLEQSLYKSSAIDQFTSPYGSYELRYWKGDAVATTKFYPHDDYFRSIPVYSKGGWAIIYNSFGTGTQFDQVFTAISPDGVEREIARYATSPDAYLALVSLLVDSSNNISVLKGNLYRGLNGNAIADDPAKTSTEIRKVSLADGSTSVFTAKFFPINNPAPSLRVVSISYHP